MHIYGSARSCHNLTKKYVENNFLIDILEKHPIKSLSPHLYAFLTHAIVLSGFFLLLFISKC